MTRPQTLRVVWTFLLALGIVEFVGSLVDGSYGFTVGGFVVVVLALGWFATAGRVLSR